MLTAIVCTLTLLCKSPNIRFSLQFLRKKGDAKKRKPFTLNLAWGVMHAYFMSMREVVLRFSGMRSSRYSWSYNLSHKCKRKHNDVIMCFLCPSEWNLRPWSCLKILMICFWQSLKTQNYSQYFILPFYTLECDKVLRIILCLETPRYEMVRWCCKVFYFLQKFKWIWRFYYLYK